MFYCFIITFAILFLDQASKLYITKVFEQGSGISLIDNILHITLVHNTGAAFGVFKKYPQVFIIISIVAAIFITIFLAKKET